MSHRWIGALLGAALLAMPASAHAAGPLGVVPDLPTGAHVVPRLGPRLGSRVAGAATARAAAGDCQTAKLPCQGGPVLHWNRTHIIFWTPPGFAFDPGYEALAEQFLADVAHDSRMSTNVYSLSGQYTDSGGPAAYDSTYGGYVVDTDPLPPSGCSEPFAPPLGSGPPNWNVCVNDSQIQTEIDNVVGAGHLPATGNDIYFLLTPNGLGDCQQAGPDNCALGGSGTGYCGYHSQTPQGILYAVIPYNAVPGHCQSDNPRPNGNPVDPTLSTLSHEHNETVTDPNPLDPAWISFSGPSVEENGDLCVTNFGPALGTTSSGSYNEVIGGHDYYLQEEWSNDDGSCQPRDETDALSIAPGRRLRASSPVSFVGRGQDPDGSIVAYTWWFGDGRTGQGRRVTHTFRHAGTYTVTVRSTDAAGNWTSTTRSVRIGAAHRTADRRRRRSGRRARGHSR